MKIKLTLAASVLAAMTFACGKDDSSSGSSSTEIDGTWTMGCTQSDSDSSTESLVISGGSATSTSKSFSDSGCATETMSLVLTGSFTPGGSVTTPTGAKELTIKTTKITVTLKTQTLVDFYNTASICGGGFVLNTAKELNATNCANDDTFKSNFTDSYTIYKLDGNKLSLGECGEDGTATDCTTAAKRATALDTTSYTKA